ncbi:uncharacterized protein K452DRAFT_283033 [Aplosporella prunicola CBS 121167]|uniref:Uncharacterized protein n=1 Tax=Aplosporella prunicola CBS 121167 TaxID=1176127 RepID=A0A6A6BSP1_9PEZI|nr:uncharacterized protein K452DRAFT_283033 [Aplosporella prunicola CBS 121167]KAF2146828.1 hypothetical protein K452DRAFT_283033 [Aplosporella prunicola CBS 121167]
MASSTPSQPPRSEAYTTPANPVTQTPSEARTAAAHTSPSDSDPTLAHRTASQDTPSSAAVPSALGRGIHGAGPGEEARGKTEEDVGRHRELDAQQMAAPGEGEVWDAVEGQGKGAGASGMERDLAADLDRKKAEQAPAREAIKAERAHDVDVAGVLGQRGGPANPVGKDGYPNTGSG